jgi:bifunctional non-homologous end joining protein LigD
MRSLPWWYTINMANDEVEVAGVKVSHPHKVIYPVTKTTKLDLIKYYERVFKLMLPDLKDRPISLVRCPGGVNGPRFYQKHPAEYFPEFIERIDIKEKTETDEYFTIDELTDVVYLVQMGAIEFHTWNCHRKDVERPDRIVFDLDPDPTADWKSVITAAEMLGERLKGIKLTPLLRTSGKKGVHVFAQIKDNITWPELKTLALEIAQSVEKSDESIFTTALPKAERKHKVFIDYLRNERGATAICNYSARVFERPTIAMPIEWDQLTTKLKPDAYDIKSV